MIRKTHCVRGHLRSPENVGANYNCLLCVRARTKRVRIEQPEVKRNYQHQNWKLLKPEVLTYYGPHHSLGCCWMNCTVIDLDMLTLDHINNDGYKHIRPGRTSRVCGRELYYWAKTHGYPDIFQTLCWNHQWKKRLAHLRALKGETCSQT